MLEIQVREIMLDSGREFYRFEVITFSNSLPLPPANALLVPERLTLLASPFTLSWLASLTDDLWAWRVLFSHRRPAPD
jgi:hypothetical protein